MHIIMGVTAELMGKINPQYANMLVATATQSGNVFWIKDKDGKPTVPYMKVEELDNSAFL